MNMHEIMFGRILGSARSPGGRIALIKFHGKKRSRVSPKLLLVLLVFFVFVDFFFFPLLSFRDLMADERRRRIRGGTLNILNYG